MKKVLALFLVMMLLGGVALAEGGALTKDLVVLFTSDIHCGIENGFGLAGLAAVRDNLAKSSHVLLVDNGDAIQGEPLGTMTTGEALIDLMNAIGYDVATMGNHEFDYGMDRFLELAAKAEFPYVSANFEKEGELVLDPYVIKEIDGVKVAFIGITTPKTITSSTPKYFQNEAGEFIYGFKQDETGEKVYAAVQAAADAARAEGAAYVIALAHLGIEASCAPWMSTDVIANTTGIDVLLDGHSHSEIAQESVLNKAGEPVLLAACGTKLENIGYLTITAAGELATGIYSWKNDAALPELLGIENEMSAAVAGATEELNKKLEEVIATTAVDLVIADPATDVRIVRMAETNLGDLCADAYRAMGDADVAFVNGGGVRVKIDAGEITLGDVLKVHPFGNALCVVEASGQQILDALEWGSRAVPEETGAFLQVSGLTYEIHTYIPTPCVQDENGMFVSAEGERRVRNVMVGGEAIDPQKIYRLASHNYMLKNSGDGYTMFKDCKLLVDEAMLDNQVLINYIIQTLEGNVGEEYADPYGQGRIVAVQQAK